MQFLLMSNPDLRPFDASHVERVLRSQPGFKNLRFDYPSGSLIECEYIEPDDWTLVSLNHDATSISLNQTSGAAIRAVLLIQKGLGMPLRMVDDDYSFDLTFSNISTVEELETAIDNARTS